MRKIQIHFIYLSSLAILVLSGCHTNTIHTSSTQEELARFEFIDQTHNEAFIVETNNKEIIFAARNELKKPLEQRLLHINGVLARGSSGINEPWSWHFVPDQWSLAEISVEFCDGWPSYVEENLEQWLKEVGSFCPWSSRITKEISNKKKLIITDPIPGYESAPKGLVGNISKTEFKEIVNDVLDSYVPLAQERSAKLYLRAPGDPYNPGEEHPNDASEDRFTRDEVLERMWSIDVPNANASKDLFTNTWYLSIYGELARQPELQVESLALIVCHELGHFFGGFPLKLFSIISGVYATPLAAEGQADYYAGQVCVKQLWQEQDNSADRFGNAYKDMISDVAVNKCDLTYTSHDDRNLCYKISYAGIQVATLWHRFNPVASETPSAGTPDNTRVDETLQMDYPTPQCRLDTYLNSAVCPTEIFSADLTGDKILYDLRKIPGIDHPNAPDSREARDASRIMTCGILFPEGARPKCWFHPEYYSDSYYSPW